MVDGESFDAVPRPDGYRPPDYATVFHLAAQVREQRQAKLDRLTATKKAIRGQWDDVIRRIPASYRKVQPEVDLPEIRDMLRRVVGQIVKHEPNFEVTPPSPRQEDIRAAAREEARMLALKQAIEDQQDQSIYGLGIESQCSWGESWISVWPDFERLSRSSEQFARGEDEGAKEYTARASRLMADGRVPIRMEVHDPQTVLPWFSRGRLAGWLVESEHALFDVELGLGYHPLKGADGSTHEWVRKTLSEPFVMQDYAMGPRITDTTHDHGGGGGGAGGRRVKSLIYVDSWVYQRYLDGVLVEEWPHDYGLVPVFPAWALESSDTDPSIHSVGIIDTALVIARQIIFYSAMLAANAMQKGWPTPFIKNPEHGLVHPVTGKPLTREIAIGQVNFLGPNEDIVFPYLQASMAPDFYRHLELLTRAFEGSSLAGFSNVNSDTSGYAVAQVRAMKEAMLGPVYRSAARQWRKLAYFYRHMVRRHFAHGGLHLRGALETTEVDGQRVRYRPVLAWTAKHCTDFAVDVHIDEGIVQDEIAERKSGLEMLSAGVWSPRRVMERSGVKDPAAEGEEIASTRLLGSPAADQLVIQMASAIAAQRLQATQADRSSPFMRALEQAQQQMAQQLTGGQPPNQGSSPVNALPGGQPIQQNQPLPAPQQGGPMAGPTPSTGLSQKDMGIPQLPGGVAGGQFAPAGA